MTSDCGRIRSVCSLLTQKSLEWLVLRCSAFQSPFRVFICKTGIRVPRVMDKIYAKKEKGKNTAVQKYHSKLLIETYYRFSAPTNIQQEHIVAILSSCRVIPEKMRAREDIHT